MIMNVIMNTNTVIIPPGCTNRLNKAFAVEIMSAVIKDNSRGERFLVSKKDMPTSYGISNL